jgi:hypothetical protein
VPSSLIQRSFAGGIVGAELAGRADQSKYQTGLKDCRNALVQRYGGVTNRTGSKLIAEAREGGASACRLIPFVFNADQTYVLEFGDGYMRVYRGGGAVVPAATAWSNATSYVVGDMALDGGVTYYCIAAHSNQDPPNASYWFPMTTGYYEIPTPYAAGDVRAIQFVQSADVVTLVHPSYAPRSLSRTAHTAWILALTSFVPAVTRPTNTSGVAGAGGGNSYRYRITAFNKDTFEESYAGRETATTITGASKANPCVITKASHPYSTGDEIYVAGIVGMTELNDRTFTITKIDANSYSLDGVNSTGYTTYTSGGTAARTYVRIDSAALPTVAAPIVLTWNNLGADYGYWIYRYKDGVYGFIGEANGNATAATTTFNDTNITESLTLTPPVEATWFDEAGNYPSAIAYIQQRLALANSTDETERIWLSQIGRWTNFSASSPIQSDDAFNFQLAGRQVNAVRHLLEVGGKLVVLTDGAEWTIQGDSDGVIRPGSVNPRQQGYTGAAAVPPVIIGATALYVQARGSIVRDLRYDFESDGYQGRDLTIFCPELFDDHNIVAWAFQQIPHNVLWAVRDDGVMLGLTYVREHDVWGWHRHDTYEGVDLYEDVCTVPEGSEDAVYVVVQRGTSRYIERFATRAIADVRDAFFVDSGLTYDGTNTGATTVTLTGGSTWDDTEELTCTASASIFAASNVDDEVRITTADGEAYACVITAYSSGTAVTVRPERLLPADIRSTATTAWALAVGTLAGLDHLEGRTVTALVDGDVQADMVVTGGAVNLTEPATIAHVGLPYTARLETLDADNLSGETWMDKKRKIHAVSVQVKDSRGLWLGYGTNTMREHQQRDTSGDYGDPIPLFSGLITERVDTTWEKTGKVIVEQRDPLPMTVLAIIPQGTIGGI